jgi:hypothetical protein
MMTTWQKGTLWEARPNRQVHVQRCIHYNAALESVATRQGTSQCSLTDQGGI